VTAVCVSLFIGLGACHVLSMVKTICSKVGVNSVAPGSAFQRLASRGLASFVGIEPRRDC